MRFITKIQSISDIITNSSSETFLMHQIDADYYDNLPDTDGCITVTRVTEEYIRDNWWDITLIQDYLGLEELDGIRMDEDFYNDYINEFIIPRMDELKDLYIVDIEDHFKNAGDVLDEARSDALASENRH